MNSGVPWQGVRPEAIETAREAARRSGMSVAEWLDSIIAESARHAGVDTPRQRRPEHTEPQQQTPQFWQRRHSDQEERHQDPGTMADVRMRLDALSRQIDDLARSGTAREPAGQGHAAAVRPIREAPSQPDPVFNRPAANSRPSNGPLEPRQSERGSAATASAATPADLVDQALAEIEARQRALDGEVRAARPEFARAPTQDLSNLEQQLRQINARMETMRPCGLDHAVDSLRDDLAEIGVLVKNAMPNQAIDGLRGDFAKLGALLRDSAPHQAIDGLRSDLAQLGVKLKDAAPLQAIDTLRGDLAELGAMLKDAVPRQAIDTLRDDLAQLGVMFKEAATPRHAIDGLREEVAEIGAMLKHAIPQQAIDTLRGDVAELGLMLKNTMPQRSIDSLRDDLAEIGVMIKEAVPRQAIEALESEVRSLSARIDDQRLAGADTAAIQGVERGLAEVRDALRILTPAENLVGYDQAVSHLSEKIDRISATDPETLKQLEGAILALRGVVSQVTSGDALAKLSEEVRALSSKVDQATAADGFSAIEERIALLAESLQARPGPVSSSRDLEEIIARLADKIERLHTTSADQVAVQHLENLIAELVQRLDASDARFHQLQAIEHGLTDLLNHFEHERVWKAQQETGETEEASTLSRDVQRAQNSLESVHDALGQVVDRLATIETNLRDAQFQRTLHRPEPMTGSGPVPAPAAFSPVLEMDETPPSAPALEPVPPFQARPAQTSESFPPAATNPAPASDRKPIDPNLPPDHPLEPGAVRGRAAGSPADRIAASEAVLENVRPPVIPDPGGKSNFIAAARRAAQAAIVEAPPPKPKSDAAGSIAGKLGGKIRKLMVGAGVALLILGSLHFAATRFWFANPAADLTGRITSEDRHPTSIPGNSDESATSRPAMNRQSALASPAITFPPSPPATAIQSPVRAPQAANPDGDTTGSIPLSVTAASVPAPLPQAPSARGNAADRLPSAFGSVLHAAAARGDASAEFEIATRYADGRGIPQNLAEAATWFERAASKGLAPAQFRLGGLYEKGIGVGKNVDTARRLYLAAAEAGNAKAMHNLAVLYAEGVEGKPDYQTAARWFRKASDHGVIDSQFNLGVLYARGIGVETDLKEAFKWFALASREGDQQAASKRDEISSRLDPQALAAAMASAQAWKEQPQPEAAIRVAVPAGGWDAAPATSTANRGGSKGETSRPRAK
jgi:localization factor PodJL